MINEEISIYVACLASYNNGILHGVWIDATLGEEHINNEIQKMLAKSPITNAEEFAIHDYCGFYDIQLSENTDINSIVEIASFLEQHGELGGEVLNHFGGDIEFSENFLEDNYFGKYSSKKDFAEQLIEDEISQLPAYIGYHFDYESFANDLFIEINGMMHVFHQS